MLHNIKTDYNQKSTDAIRTEIFGSKQRIVSPDYNEATWSQQKISLLEQKETIDAPLLQQISAALKIPVEAIQNFDEEQAINIISNTINNSDSASGNFLFNYQFTFNPIDTMIELYERMLE